MINTTSYVRRVANLLAGPNSDSPLHLALYDTNYLTLLFDYLTNQFARNKNFGEEFDNDQVILFY